MLKKTLPILLLTLFLPATALAECGLAMTGATMTIVVGKKTDKCFTSSGFADTFKATVTEALEEDEPRMVAQKRPIDERNARGRKLWTIAERQHQVSGGRYFGQK